MDPLALYEQAYPTLVYRAPKWGTEDVEPKWRGFFDIRICPVCKNFCWGWPQKKCPKRASTKLGLAPSLKNVVCVAPSLHKRFVFCLTWVHIHMLYPLTPVGLDVQLLRGRGCYSLSCFMFWYVWALHYSLIIFFYCITVVE